MFLVAYVLVPEMLEELEFSVGSFRKDWCRKRFHNLLDRHSLSRQLILCRAISSWLGLRLSLSQGIRLPDQTKGTHAYRLQIRVPDRLSILAYFS